MKDDGYKYVLINNHWFPQYCRILKVKSVKKNKKLYKHNFKFRIGLLCVFILKIF